MQSSDQVRIVIPARFASSRLPGKPLVDLAGKPMVVRVHDAVVSALPTADVVIAIDDERILTALEAHGLQGVMTAVSWESGTDRVAEVARLRRWGADDLIINVQGDEPQLPAALLQQFVAFCEGRAALDVGTVAVPLSDQAQIVDPNVVKVVTDATQRALYFSRAPIPFERDAAPQSWLGSNHLRHVGIYAYRNAVLQRITEAPQCDLEKLEKLEQLRAMWLGFSIHVMHWAAPPPAGVDTPADALRVAAEFTAVDVS